ncbi:hypothetical protein JTE90_004184 [Oedothorax gibbosus]|uniref:Uncharacterized protein n=1 Tax=Oedothorax gibbosus TaxID=931172 RepID=A0AAV6USU7_9ARAC|nr:hypothetical protein JTE90_004184 [Oedothorax gibbosus]
MPYQLGSHSASAINKVLLLYPKFRLSYLRRTYGVTNFRLNVVPSCLFNLVLQILPGCHNCTPFENYGCNSSAPVPIICCLSTFGLGLTSSDNWRISQNTTRSKARRSGLETRKRLQNFVNSAFPHSHRVRTTIYSDDTSTRDSQEPDEGKQLVNLTDHLSFNLQLGISTLLTTATILQLGIPNNLMEGKELVSLTDRQKLQFSTSIQSSGIVKT